MTYWLGVAAIGLLVGLSIQFVQGWTEPLGGTLPPAGNVGAPINTGGIGQIKDGDLIINNTGAYPIGLTINNNLDVLNGNVRIGTTTPQSPAPNGATSGNIDSNDVYLRSISKWASQMSGVGGVPKGVQAFTANGTFTVPAGVTQILVEVWGATGGGGGGGGGATTCTGGGGGGGGGEGGYYKDIVSVSPSSTINVVIGAGGAGGAGGNDGSNSLCEVVLLAVMVGMAAQLVSALW